MLLNMYTYPLLDPKNLETQTRVRLVKRLKNEQLVPEIGKYQLLPF